MYSASGKGRFNKKGLDRCKYKELRTLGPSTSVVVTLYVSGYVLVPPYGKGNFLGPFHMS